MFSIPPELLEEVERNNVMPLVGEGINRGVLPSLAEVAGELAARCEYPADEPQTLTRVATYYSLAGGDRHSLVSFLRDRLGTSGLEPSLSHKLLVKLRPRIVVTTCYDRLLERAVQKEGLSYTPVVANEEVVYGDEQRMKLVWLWGMLDRPESTVITEDDHGRFLATRKILSYVLGAELAQRNWLFLGFDTQDDWFLRFYEGVVRELDRHHRRSYIVGTKMSDYARAWWSVRAQILDVEIEPFLSELVDRLNPAGRLQPDRSEKEAREVVDKPIQVGSEKRPANAGLPSGEPEENEAGEVVDLLRPYKHLDFYEAADARIFFGRGREIQALSSLIHAHRLVLFYGTSGAGKTSLLLAGIVPRLEQAQAGYETFHLRTFDDPIASIRRAVRRRFSDVDLPSDGSLVKFLDKATRAMGCSLVIMFDQFEEFFIRFNPRLRQAFIAELGSLYDAHDVPVKVVLALREDWLASINEIRERIPGIFYTDLRLLPLTREQARQAITGPVGQMPVPMHYDASLVDQLLDDLGEDTVDSEDNFVMPPQLQLVCCAMYDHASAEGRQNIAMDDYENVGGAQGILERFVEKALTEYQGDARAIARGVLKALVTSHETKGGGNLESLAAELGTEVMTIEPVLSSLTGQRLVHCLVDGKTYELTHDILASTIASWISEEDRQLKQTRELLDREMADWTHDRGILLSQSKFRRINAARDLLHFGDEEAAFLLRGAILYDEAVPYWLEKVSGSDVRSQILLEMLASDFEHARLSAAGYLVDFPQESVTIALAQTALTDSDPAVRRAAAASLGQMGMDAQTAIPPLIDALGEGERQRQSRAVRALAIIADRTPEILRVASRPIPPAVYLELAQIRLRQAWPWIRLVTVAGAIGGALGTGLGLGLPEAVHASAISGGQWSVLDLIFIVPLIATFGMLAGAMMAFGLGAGESLLRERANMGGIAGSAFLGGLGFAIIFSPLMIVQPGGITDVLWRVVGAGLLGLLIALGIALPMAVRWPRIATLLGGAVGGGIGIVLWGILGYAPLQEESVPLAVLLTSGALCGLIMAAAVVIAEARRHR